MKRTKQSTFARRERSEKSTGFAPVGGEDMTQPAKHTPGPWVADTCDWPIIVNGPDAGESNVVCTVEGQYDKKDLACIYQYPMEQAEANAHLIAAAPTMYEALKAMIDSCLLIDDPAHATKPYYEESRQAYLLAKAALAQAEGQQ